MHPLSAKKDIARKYPFVKVSDMNLPANAVRIQEANNWISEDDLKELRAKPFARGTVVFAKIGEAIRQNRLRQVVRETIVDNNMMGAVPDIHRVNPRFFFYALSQFDFSEIAQGTALPYLTVSTLSGLELEIPPLDEQRAIAHILGTLDDKIELNRRMNETLEAIARAIFKSWFVDFDPVRSKAEGRDPGLPKHIADLFPDSFEDSELGEIPKGWEVAELGEITDIIDCLHSKKPERRDIGRPLLQLWNIRDDGLIDMDDTYFIDESDYEIWISRMEASPGDCVITNVGRVGAVAQMPMGQKAALGRNMTGLRCKPAFAFPTFLIECLLSQAMIDEIARKMDTGTILDALNVRNIPKLRLAIPKEAIVMYFDNLVRPIRAQMERNLGEALTLAALRDTLLPSLISGRLRVKCVDKILEAAI